VRNSHSIEGGYPTRCEAKLFITINVATGAISVLTQSQYEADRLVHRLALRGLSGWRTGDQVRRVRRPARRAAVVVSAWRDDSMLPGRDGPRPLPRERQRAQHHSGLPRGVRLRRLLHSGLVPRDRRRGATEA